jgi:DNA-binding LacI/PurR family transcriptional regulator
MTRRRSSFGRTARLADVAQQVGVSEATVSRVLNDKPGVAREKREAVRRALDRFGYDRPTLLRDERAPLVGLVLPELQNPIFPAFAEIVSASLVQRGFTPLLCTGTAAGATEREYVELLLNHHVAGVVFAGGLYAQADAQHDHYARLAERRLPAVFVNAAIDELDFPRVSCDDTAAIEQALGHLVALGHDRIGAVLGPPDHLPSRRKLATFTKIMAGGFEPELVQHTMFTLEGAEAAAGRVLERDATAIVCASDVLALGAIRAARRAGRGVPADCSVVGFDDSALMSCTDPPLTTVRQPIAAMARAAVRILTGHVEGRPIPARELLFEPELVVRGSSAPVPTGRKRSLVDA